MVATKKANILFTGGRSPATLDLIRLFAKDGYNNFVAESLKSNLSGVSKHVKKNFLIPSAALETEDFIYHLVDIIREYRIDVLIPNCEEVFYISKYKQKLEKYCYVFTSSIDILTQLHSKFQFIELLEKLDIHYPKSQLIDHKHDLIHELKNRDKFVLKPEFSRFASQVIINDKSNEKIDSIRIDEQYKWVLQEYIKGDAFCSYSVAQDGKVLASSIYPSIYFAGQGGTVHFESVDIPEIYLIIEKIVSELNYTGQISFDFIRSDTNGICYPIECNPRSTSGVHLFLPEDHLPSTFIKDANVDKTIKAKVGNTKTVTLAMLVFCVPKVKNVAQGKQLFKKIVKSQDVVFNIKDLKPFIYQFISLSHYASKGKKNNMSIMAATTIDIEWNGD